MSTQNNILPVAGKFIERGISKYKGEVDTNLQRLLKNSDCDFVPYKFIDGRYLLVQEATNFAFLYPDLETVYQKLVLE